MKTITLTAQECAALHDLIYCLSGGNPEYAFDWDGPNDPRDPGLAACAKVYHAAGRRIPDDLRHHVGAKEDNKP